MMNKSCTLILFCINMLLQHRMRPEIARLLTPHIYSDLENHASVLEYENIKVSIFINKISMQTYD